MAFAITQTCCSDATCVSVCPVNCIHPTPEERAFGSTEMLHIDPRSCIDCGACADACPVDAVFPVDRLPATQREYARINAAYFEPGGTPESPDRAESGEGVLRSRARTSTTGESRPSTGYCPRTSGRCVSRSSAPARPGCTPPGTCCCTHRPR